jgi:hypothetical protein
MTQAQSQSVVIGREEVEETFEKKQGRFLFWKTEWWEKVHTEHIGNDIVIKTDKPIRSIYLNGREIKV